MAKSKSENRSLVYDQYDFDGKRDLIVDYAARGFSGAYIARATGFNISVIYAILKSEYQERCANRQSMIQAQDQTIRWLMLKITDRIHKSEGKWARQDAELLLKLMERQAKLHGLDSAQQHEVTVTVEEMTDEKVMEQLRAEGFEIKQLMPPAQQVIEPPVEDAEVVEKLVQQANSDSKQITNSSPHN